MVSPARLSLCLLGLMSAWSIVAAEAPAGLSAADFSGRRQLRQAPPFSYPTTNSYPSYNTPPTWVFPSIPTATPTATPTSDKYSSASNVWKVQTVPDAPPPAFSGPPALKQRLKGYSGPITLYATVTIQMYEKAFQRVKDSDTINDPAGGCSKALGDQTAYNNGIRAHVAEIVNSQYLTDLQPGDVSIKTQFTCDGPASNINLDDGMGSATSLIKVKLPLATRPLIGDFAEDLSDKLVRMYDEDYSFAGHFKVQSASTSAALCGPTMEDNKCPWEWDVYTISSQDLNLVLGLGLGLGLPLYTFIVIFVFIIISRWRSGKPLMAKGNKTSPEEPDTDKQDA